MTKDTCFEETFEGQVIEPVAEFGVMQVYRRKGWRVSGLSKYVVFHADGRALEEFRCLGSAIRWAKDNRSG